MMGPQSRLINSRERRRIPRFYRGQRARTRFPSRGRGLPSKDGPGRPATGRVAVSERTSARRRPHSTCLRRDGLRPAEVTIFERGKLRWWPAALGPVWMMSRSQPELVVYVDRYSARWTTPHHAPRGNDIIALGAVSWKLPYREAAWRLATICSFDAVAPAMLLEDDGFNDRLAAAREQEQLVPSEAIAQPNVSFAAINPYPWRILRANGQGNSKEPMRPAF